LLLSSYQSKKYTIALHILNVPIFVRIIVFQIVTVRLFIFKQLPYIPVKIFNTKVYALFRQWFRYLSSKSDQNVLKEYIDFGKCTVLISDKDFITTVRGKRVKVTCIINVIAVRANYHVI
jgi:hypothetical protein